MDLIQMPSFAWYIDHVRVGHQHETVIELLTEQPSGHTRCGSAVGLSFVKRPAHSLRFD
jgi:hypothetical protein